MKRAIGAAAVVVGVWAWLRRRKPRLPPEVAGPDVEPGRGLLPATVPPPIGVGEEVVAQVDLVTEAGRPYRGDATVSLAGGAEPYELTFDGTGRYSGRVPSGAYRLTVRLSEPSVIVPERVVPVFDPASVHIAEVLAADTPAFRLAGRVVPFSVKEDLTGVLVPGADAGRLRRFVELARDRLSLRLVDPDQGEPNEGKGPSQRLAFQSPKGPADPDSALALRRLAAEAGLAADTVRAGVMVQSPRLGLALLDRTWIVKASAVEPEEKTGKSAPPERLTVLLRDVGAEVVRELAAPGTWLVRFGDDDWRRHLRVGEELVASGVADYAEPDLVSASPNAAVTVADWDASGQRSPNLERMNLRPAWEQSPGSSSVVVATVDDGVDPASPYVDGSTLQYVWSTAPDADPAPASDHGMQVYSAASGQGKDGCWGVSPNVTHVALKRPGWFGHEYWSALVTAASAHGARVLSLSHEGTWPSGYGSEVLHQLADSGVVVVVAAGNGAGRLVAASGAWSARPECSGSSTNPADWRENPLASHPRTIAVASTMLTAGRETFWRALLYEGGVPVLRASHRGEPIDLCAFADELTVATLGAPGPASGTSFAAPLVAGTAALILSARPDLRPSHVRTILCSTADKVEPESACWVAPGPLELGEYPWPPPPAAPVEVRRDWAPGTALPTHHLRYGFGRLNIGAAVTAALAYPSPAPD